MVGGSASLLRSTPLELLDFVEPVLLTLLLVDSINLEQGEWKITILHVHHRFEELSTHVTNHSVDCHRRDNNHDKGDREHDHENRGSLGRKRGHN